MSETKTCIDCNETKPNLPVNFRKNYTYCRNCERARNRNYAKKRREKFMERQELFKNGTLTPSIKQCRTCKEEKEDTVENFNFERKNCVECERNRGKNYRRGEHGHNKAKKWLEENPERMKNLQSEWHQNNKKKIYENAKERKKNDFGYKVWCLQKGRLHGAFRRYKNSGIKKNGRTIKYIGCNIKHLVDWLEFCIKDHEEIKIENHGELWHMDHVIPIANFDLTDENQQELAFNWRNISPLYAQENLVKNKKIVAEQVLEHYNKLIEFHELHKLEFPIKFKDLYAKHLDAGNPLEPYLPPL